MQEQRRKYFSLVNYLGLRLGSVASISAGLELGLGSYESGLGFKVSVRVFKA